LVIEIGFKMHGEKIRVLSYNIHKGFNQLNRKYIAEEIRKSIRLINADILFLQEVIGRNDKHNIDYHEWDDDSQLEYLSDSVWHHYAYGKNAIYDHGHHGNAILSKHPFTEWKNIDISCVKKSHRGILLGKLDTDINVLCTHFGLLPSEQKTQSALLSECLDELLQKKLPLILAGDFNDFSLQTHKLLTQQLHLDECFEFKYGKLSRTFPSIFPIMPLDRIYFSGMELVNCERLSGDPWNRLSDHCALYAEFKL
jgi:endonuclease/exonuclease/phosphatase family metal-dependent hydrolase